MKRVLIVSPNFPPLNAADMHRVRTSLPYFRDFGWEPHVLAVGSAWQIGVIEPQLAASLPVDIPVTRTRALPLRTTRPFGIGNVALRAFGHLYRAGARIIRREQIDLVYISTTMFAAMALGRLWKARFGTPYVLDMQDPWIDESGEAWRGLPKQRQARLLHGILEPFTMRGVDGLIAVSSAYTDTLRKRYPWIAADRCVTLPFGACEDDFHVASNTSWSNPFFRRDDGLIHGAYVGAVSEAMRIAARLFFRGLRQASAPRARDVRVTFVGTSYAPAGRQEKRVEADAIAEGLSGIVREFPDRLPYFDALRLVRDAHFLLILGSADAAYTPSKLFQYLLARRPLVAVLHEQSPVIELVRRSGAAIVATFTGPADMDAQAERLGRSLAELLPKIPFEPSLDWSVMAPFMARDLTRRQCAVFDAASGTA